MKTGLLKGIFGVTFLVGAGAVMAGPLNRADIPGEPAWVLHLDWDALRPTVLGQFVLTEMEKPEAKAKLSVFESLFSFDPRKQLHGMTLYSSGKGSEDGVLLLYADFDPERLTTLAKAAKEYQGKKHNQHMIHSWVDTQRDAKKEGGRRTYGAIHGGRVIFGQRWSRVGEALDVLDRTSPSLASSGSFAQLGAPGTANFLEAAARKLELGSSDPNAAVFRLSKVIRLQAGEAQRQLTATLNLETNDEETAKLIASIAQGLVSLVKLQRGKAETAKLIDAVTLKQNGQGVIATLNLPAEELVTILKAESARKASKAAAEDSESQ
jgi:hypothetical protein